MNNNIRAKVFISCGQKKNTEEIEVAKTISSVLDNMGFDPYVASEEQTLRGLKENIFYHLLTAEYFLFVDFKREQFANIQECRGSLFSNQELSIAAYLDLEVMAIQQAGVKKLDGMSSALQLNYIPFDKPEELPEIVHKQVKDKNWKTDWKNALSITKATPDFSDAVVVNQQEKPKARFFHLSINNLNHKRIALDCVGYVESIKDLTKDKQIDFQTTELKWAGYTQPSVAIIHKSYRKLDAFLLYHHRPTTLYFNCFSDSSDFMKPIQGPGDFELTYVIISKNFPLARAKFKIHLGNQLSEFRFDM